jgi:DNA-binding Lrp family transcriptional regulator
MVNAIILLNVEQKQINGVAEALTNFEEVSEVYSVGGRVDLVTIARVEHNDNLANLVTRKIVKLEGILNTETMIAFRTYSQHDLERMFSLGLE